MLSAQENETEMKYYHWKGKKTEFQSGYVTLKSGKTMKGKIKLKGSKGHVEELTFTDGSKEFTIPRGSIKAYGLDGYPSKSEARAARAALPPPQSDCDEAFFKWPSSYSISGSGDTTRSSKPRNGYVILHNGNRIEGELKLKKRNSVITEFNIKNDNGKQKYQYAEVRNYGLKLTIAEITNNGKKVYPDAPRNFHPGTVSMKDGTTRKGLVSFIKKLRVHPTQQKMGLYYTGIMFTETQAGFIDPISSADAKGVTQEVNGSTVEYIPYEDGFVDKNMFDKIEFKDPTKMFQEGEIFLSDGSSRKGDIMQQKGGMSWFSTNILFKDESGTPKKFTSLKVDRFTQKIDGRVVEFISHRGAFIELIYGGNNFHLFRNPFPTSVNGFLTGLAKTATNVAASGTQMALEKDIVKKSGASEEEQDEMVNNFQSKVNAMSNEELSRTIQQCSDLKKGVSKGGNEPGLSKASGRVLDEIILIATIELTSRAASSGIEIKKKEWIFMNLKTNEATIVTRSDYKDQVEPLLGSCPSYLMMEKKEQKDINSFDAIDKAIKLLDECYDE